MSAYKRYLKGQIEVCDMTLEEFNEFMLEHYAGYIGRGGKMSFQEFMKFCEEIGF